MKGPRKYASKYVVCGVWLAVVAIGAIHAGGFHRVDLLFGTGSANELRSFLFLYWPFLIVIPPSLIFGRWASCHYMCWIAPLLIGGKRVGEWMRLRSLRIKPNPASCKRCESRTAA